MIYRLLIVGLLTLCSIPSFAKIGIGAGADVNPNAARLSVRGWFSKYAGLEIGFGPTASFDDFKFDDMSIQGKYFYALRYDRFSRTYLGAIARYTLVKDPFFDKDLPSAGVFGGKEWYLGRYRNQGVAVEAGLLYGKAKDSDLDWNWETGEQYNLTKKEFPAFISLSYKYYF